MSEGQKKPKVSAVGLANLVQNRPEVTPEQRRAWAIKASQASAAARKRIRSQREILQTLLELQCTDKAARDAMVALGLAPNFANAINLAALQKASRGDIEATRYVRDTIGEKPTETMNLGVSNTPVKALDMTKLSDAELEALADRVDSED